MKLTEFLTKSINSCAIVVGASMLISTHGVAACTPGPGDFDGDCVPDGIEAELLAQFTPVWRANDANQRPPLPIDWYIAHCRLRVYDHEYNGSSNPGLLIGDSANRVLTLPYLINHRYDEGYYRLTFKEGMFRNGDDPADRMTWQRAQSEGRCVYGRVASLTSLPGCNTPDSGPECSDRYLIQYYMFFGYNVTDHPDERFGPCGNFGNHEGDLVCVEFEVQRPESEPARILRAVYNNHGRKIFIDSPAGLRYEQGHPIVYLERESQEPVPWPSSCGFASHSSVPPCVGTDEIFVPENVSSPWGVYSFGGECDDFQVVREHFGGHFGETSSGFLVTSVVNLGEAGTPGASLEAQFLDKYPGLFGDEAFDEGCFCYIAGMSCFKIKNVDSPKGPHRQASMWCRERHNNPRNPQWPGCKSLGTVQINFGYTGAQAGTSSQPFNSLPNALPVAATGGTLVMIPGSTGFRGTICQPVSLTAPGGLVTIGQ